jgi:predicted GNAT family acetyltransferase
MAEAQALVERAKPGPFGERALELGDYVGCFEHGQLIAMAGERLHAEGAREISAVCTHPEFRGRGLARRLVSELVCRQVARGEKPFLHVLISNEGARDLYRSMGFRDLEVSRVRIISRSVERASAQDVPTLG